MFAPATVLALVVGHCVERFRRSPVVAGILRTLAPAVIGMLGAATFSLGHAAVGVPVDVGVAALAFVVLARWGISPMWLLMGAGLVRTVVSMHG
jgi:chromate transport protein ChrA